VAGASSGVSVQNNIVNSNGTTRTGCDSTAGQPVDIRVYDAATGHTVVDYNHVYQGTASATHARQMP
jgi:hypothetical protein